MLVDSNKIFTFLIVEADRKERIRRVDGFLVTEGNLIKELAGFYEERLIKIYSEEYQKKLVSAEKVLGDMGDVASEHNNTKLGITANIVMAIIGCQKLLEKNIMNYGPKKQQQKLEEVLKKSEPLSSFIADPAIAGDGNKKKEQEQKKSARRAVDSKKFEEFQKNAINYSIDKTLAVYGVEFYTRVVFREYKFGLMEKLVKEGKISKKSDLLVIKQFLQRERANSDKDLNLQKYAGELNSLEKTINSILKQG
jgi:hypothetical protein